VRAWTAAMLLAVAGGAAAQAPPPPVFGARVETVHVDVFVSRGGQPVLGLGASNFELKDNGVVQAVELAATDSLPLLAVLAFDTSESVAGEKLAALQAAGLAFLDGLKPGDEAALLAFRQEIEWLQAPSRDRALVKRRLDGLRPRGATAVRDGLYAALTLPVSGARMLVVLFSDGEDNVSWLDERQVRAAAERSNALVHVVAWRPPAPWQSPDSIRQGAPVLLEPEHLRSLREVAEVTGGRLWEAESPERLRGAFAAIAQAMGHRYVLRYEPRGVSRTGHHRIELRLRGARGEVRARRGYWVGAR
jgi:VWFA-related protein